MSGIRERTEALEYEILAPEAAKSREAVRKNTVDLCPFRTSYQRDRDRILHSKAFRRLKHKTQVYIMSGDHYRTRMTHSLEVAQISRTIARGLRLNEDLVEAIGLGHDVGHTPFGHSGEAVMDELTGHFAHNEQSLRVVEHLERGGEGLNLTFDVKDGIVNHTGDTLPKTLEGRVVRIADRIAYLCHDYDDSIRAGLLKPGDLPKGVTDVLGTSHSQMITGFVSDLIVNSAELKDIELSPEMQKVMTTFRNFMFENIYHSDALKTEREQAGFVLRELYKYFFDNFEKLPEEFIAREERWGRKQVVVDYVAGLTDSYAVQLFQEIFVPPVAFITR
ncbi:MAG: deoxyguanosinetriphosphate triphosphohydrolase [Schwartzia sp.]|nr:deoxyguanosinetriphosphate triphosphohydrolase [Schwartzia sp. (in: firmicutes)]